MQLSRLLGEMAWQLLLGFLPKYLYGRPSSWLKPAIIFYILWDQEEVANKTQLNPELNRQGSYWYQTPTLDTDKITFPRWRKFSEVLPGRDSNNSICSILPPQSLFLHPKDLPVSLGTSVFDAEVSSRYHTLSPVSSYFKIKTTFNLL